MAAKDSFIESLLMMIIIAVLANLLGWHEMKVGATVPIATKTSLPFNRSCFPPDFIFGTASSAYQVPALHCHYNFSIHVSFFISNLFSSQLFGTISIMG